MNKPLSPKEAAQEKMMDALMEYAANCYKDHMLDTIDAEKEKFYQENTFPPELDVRMKKFFRRRQLKEDFLQAGKKGSQILAKVAVVFLAVCLSLGVLAATSEAARVKILNFLIEAEDDFTKIRFQPGLEKEAQNDEVSHLEGIPEQWGNVYIPEYIPEGFKIVNTETYASTKIIYYANEQGEQIEFSQYTSETMELMIDTEDAQVEKVLIHGVEGLMSEKEGFTAVVWHNQEHSFYLASEIEREELIKMAKNVGK
ncbi:hypothetical protein HMPREF0322_01624 [Desulfitobacterium hafniense DP7]|uniref:DUF4367 domain-containing protein n=1 Tax=Desulfitobacterium hafniense DP7 TaxID=537010 RepID=G9XL13_DESHA|nr:DUF4367 domain-containing protein [Desulfitobacterium hafniense]EHL07730.1 hypothetical protein HMPREF0322_01624 [Desulfitobacterium hafniense DP7]